MTEHCNDSNDKTIQQLVKINSEMVEKVNRISKELDRLKEISRMVIEIHSLQFSKDFLEKNDNLTQKFLAEMILEKPRKRRK